MTKALIIGNGSIGSEIKRQIEGQMMKHGWSVAAVFSIDKILDAKGMALDDISNWKTFAASPMADVVFLAIPTDGGETALAYIEYFTGQGIPVVTCEKGALAHHFPKLQAYIQKKMLGYAATVGGGTKMLPYLNGRLLGGTMAQNIDKITGVLNGTLNYMFSRLSAGADKATVLSEILEKRYAEPGASTFETIIAGEMGDLHKKGVILANVSGLMGESFLPDDTFQIDPEKLALALDNPREHRFLVSISRQKHPDFLSGIEYDQNGWQLQVGLFNIKDIGATLMLPQGVNNALYIEEGASVFSVSGPGAGPEPTAHAMIMDALELLA